MKKTLTQAQKQENRDKKNAELAATREEEKNQMRELHAQRLSTLVAPAPAPLSAKEKRQLKKTNPKNIGHAANPTENGANPLMPPLDQLNIAADGASSSTTDSYPPIQGLKTFSTKLEKLSSHPSISYISPVFPSENCPELTFEFQYENDKGYVFTARNGEFAQTVLISLQNRLIFDQKYVIEIVETILRELEADLDDTPSDIEIEEDRPTDNNYGIAETQIEEWKKTEKTRSNYQKTQIKNHEEKVIHNERMRKLAGKIDHGEDLSQTAKRDEAITSGEARTPNSMGGRKISPG